MSTGCPQRDFEFVGKWVHNALAARRGAATVRSPTHAAREQPVMIRIRTSSPA